MTDTPIAAGSANITAIVLPLGIILILGALVAAIVISYNRLQQHRSDAVAMASYRKLAEEATANQREIIALIQQLTAHISAVEQLMRDVG
jgi:hypothetical protein